MKSVIWKIFNGQADEDVHSDFLKFSRGVFENRYLVEGKKQKDKWAIKTSAEFANFLVARCLKGADEVKMSGAIICTFDLRDKVNFEIERVKQFAGVKQHLINSSVQAKDILELMEKYPRAFYALTFSVGGNELKIKAKPPKSAKPGNKSKDDEGPKADFCSLKTPDSEIVKDLFFDFPSFSEIKIRHTIDIKEIEIPVGEKDPVKMRENSKRKGVVKRIVSVDGREEVKEMKFEA